MKPPPPETQAIRSKKRQRRDRWLRERERGFASYVLRRGVLAWGVPIALFFIGMQWGEYHHSIGIILLVNILIWLPIGGLFGASTWYARELRYKRCLASKMAHSRTGT